MGSPRTFERSGQQLRYRYPELSRNGEKRQKGRVTVTALKASDDVDMNVCPMRQLFLAQFELLTPFAYFLA